MTSLVMSIIIILFFIHREFRSRRFSSKMYYWIWIIIAIRLVLPFDMSGENKLYNFSIPISEYQYIDNEVNQERIKYEIEKENDPNEIIKNENETNITIEDKKGNVQDKLSKIWLTGGLLYFSYNLILYLVFKIRVQKSLSFVDEDIETRFNTLKNAMIPNKRVSIKESKYIDSPMVIGLIKPTLLISKNINRKNIDYIFKHEFVHLKRRDIFYKLIIFLSTTIHWFNPVVHIMARRAGEDLEISCDEEATKDMDEEDRIKYSKTLIDSISLGVKSPIYTTNFCGGKKVVKKRLDQILDKIIRKSGKSIIALLAIFVLSTGLLIGCETKGKQSLTDELYSYRTEYVGDNSKVGNIVSRLEFPQKYNYKSMEILSKEEPYGLKLYFTENKGEDFKASIEQFKIPSTIIFSLIDNLDEITYILEKENEEIVIGTLEREYVDSITISVLGMNTKEIGSSKKKFSQLVEFYETYNRENILNLEDAYTDHYHFKEHHNGNVYLIRRIEPAAGEEWTDDNWTDELWRYDKNNKGEKLYACQGLDFRVSPNEKYIAIIDHDELCIIDAEGHKIKKYTIEELSNGEYKNEDELHVDMQGWSDDSLNFWGGVNDLWLPLKLFKINAVDWSITEYDVTQLPIGDAEFMLNSNTGKIVFSDFPITFNVDDLSEFEASKEKVTLFYYDLAKKKLMAINSSVAKMFNPKWIDDFTIEYDNPKGQGRIRYKLKD